MEKLQLIIATRDAEVRKPTEYQEVNTHRRKVAKDGKSRLA
jgi:hypothetical protein